MKDELLAQGMPPERTIAIPNGVRLAPFENADAHPLAQRIPGIVMVARLSKQKDHATLIRAVAHLRDRGHVVPVLFAGGGKTPSASRWNNSVRLLGLARPGASSSASRATCRSCC